LVSEALKLGEAAPL